MILLLLSACSSQQQHTQQKQPAPVDEINQRVRTPASQDSAGVQVYSLQNPAVKQLTAQANDAEKAGNLDQAVAYLRLFQSRAPHPAEVEKRIDELKQKMDGSMKEPGRPK